MGRARRAAFGAGVRGDDAMGGAGTRIASISGLRGVVGDGLDPRGRVGVRGGLREPVRARPDRGGA